MKCKLESRVILLILDLLQLCRYIVTMWSVSPDPCSLQRSLTAQERFLAATSDEMDGRLISAGVQGLKVRCAADLPCHGRRSRHAVPLLLGPYAHTTYHDLGGRTPC